MGLKFWDFLRPKEGKAEYKEVDCRELFLAAKEWQIRELCFAVCVEMIANAVGRCEFRTFRGEKEIYERDYWLWNFEPNSNENSTVFIHKLIDRLCRDNEALIVEFARRGGGKYMLVADNFLREADNPNRLASYSGVTVGTFGYNKIFREDDVLHLTLQNANIRRALDGITEAYGKMLDAAVDAYKRRYGEKWKVHISQIAAGTESFEENFARMIEAQLKPFFNSERAVLPEFDGYEYKDMSGSGSSAEIKESEIKNLTEDIFDYTARAFLIPAVLINGKVEAAENAEGRFLTHCIDPICDQLQEEITRKHYGYDEWNKGNFLRVDTSAIQHFDLFANAANVEKLVGSGAFNINDIRRAAGQPAINEAWADKHYMTLNINGMGEQTRTLGDDE